MDNRKYDLRRSPTKNVRLNTDEYEIPENVNRRVGDAAILTVCESDAVASAISEAPQELPLEEARSANETATSSNVLLQRHSAGDLTSDLAHAHSDMTLMKDTHPGSSDSLTRRDENKDAIVNMLLAIQNQMEAQAKSMREESKAMKKSLENQMENIKTQNKSLENNLENKIDKIDTKFTQQSQELKSIRDEISQIRTEIETEIQAQVSTLRKEINEVINDEFHTIRQQQTESLNEIQATCETNTQRQCDLTRSIVSKEIKHQSEIIQQTKEAVENLKINTDAATTENQVAISKLESEIGQLKNAPTNLNHNGPTEILVTCTGGENSDNVPTFTGKEQYPNEYLSKLRSHIARIEATRGKSRTPHMAIIGLSLKGSAARWWEITKPDVHDFDEFQRVFLEKYWNPEIQRAVKRRIENEVYRPNGKLSRSEHFVEGVLVLQNMSPAYDDQDIVSILSNRYDSKVNDARLTQNVTTIKEFEKLLTRFDIEDKYNYNRRNNENMRREPDRKPNFEPRQSPNKRNPYEYRRDGQANNRYHDTRQNNNFRTFHPRNQDNHPYRRNDNYHDDRYDRRQEAYRERERPTTEEQRRVIQAIRTREFINSSRRNSYSHSDDEETPPHSDNKNNPIKENVHS